MQLILLHLLPLIIYSKEISESVRANQPGRNKRFTRFSRIWLPIVYRLANLGSMVCELMILNGVQSGRCLVSDRGPQGHENPCDGLAVRKFFSYF